MPFSTPDYPVIRDAILRDIKNLLQDAAVGSDSDFYVRASAVASAIEGLYQHQQWVVRQIFPDAADVDMMETHAALRRITRKAANKASGTIAFTGTAASAIPIGTEAKSVAGIAFVTTAAGVLDGTGNATIAAQASLAGAAGNLAAAATLALTAAPAGVNGAASIVTMLGGTDIEADAALLGRLLDVLRNPPSSGNTADYKRWALEVAGADQAYVYPQRRGAGTTDVIITSAGGLPSAQLITDVQTHIDAARPVGVNTLSVLAPAIVLVNIAVQVKLSGITLADATTKITAAVDGYFATLKPGDTYVKSVSEASISDIPGITDRAVTSPAANVVPTVDATTVQWCRKGTLAVTLMP